MKLENKIVFNSNLTEISEINMFTVTDLDTDEKFSVGSPTSSIIVPDKYGNTTKALIFGDFEALYNLAINEEANLLDKKELFSERTNHNKTFSIREYTYSNVPRFNKSEVYVLWNFYHE